MPGNASSFSDEKKVLITKVYAKHELITQKQIYPSFRGHQHWHLCCCCYILFPSLPFPRVNNPVSSPQCVDTISYWCLFYVLISWFLSNYGSWLGVKNLYAAVMSFVWHFHPVEWWMEKKANDIVCVWWQTNARRHTKCFCRAVGIKCFFGLTYFTRMNIVIDGENMAFLCQYEQNKSVHVSLTEAMVKNSRGGHFLALNHETEASVAAGSTSHTIHGCAVQGHINLNYLLCSLKIMPSCCETKCLVVFLHGRISLCDSFVIMTRLWINVHLRTKVLSPWGIFTY